MAARQLRKIELLSQEAFDLADRGLFIKAIELLRTFKTTTDVEKRIVGNTLAEILMLQGKYDLALYEIQETRKKYGDHIALLADQVCCLYAISDFKRWKFTLQELKNTYNQYKDIFSKERQVTIELTIAKHVEEEGAIKGALDAYMTLLEKVDEQTDIRRYYRILCQSFRVLSTFQTSSNLNAHYALLNSVNAKNFNIEADVDVQQCLMLGEIKLLGVESAKQRLHVFLRNREANDYDKQLLTFDFIEELLSQGVLLPADVYELLSTMDESKLNPYEKNLVALSLNGPEVFPTWLPRSQSQMSYSCYLRLLGAALVVFKNSEFNVEIRRQFKLALDILDDDSKRFWISRYRTHLVTEKPQITFLATTSILKFKEKEVSVARKETFKQVLLAIHGQTAIATEEVIQKIWNASFSDSYYRSLRMIVHRLNEVLFELTGIPKLIDINKQNLTAKAIVKLISDASVNP